jgi:hypothetical protein
MSSKKRGKDWVPRSDKDFDEFFKNYRQEVMKNCTGSDPVWAHIPTARVTKLTTAYSDWGSAFIKTKGPHTEGDTQAKDEQRLKSEKILRAFNRQYVLDAEEVTDAQRRDIGCPVHDNHPSTINRPEALAEADVTYFAKNILKLVKIRPVPGTMSEEEAELDFGVRIFWGILGAPTENDKFRLAVPPLTGNDLPHSTFTHRKSYRFDFDGDSGKTVYFCLRYENGKGGKEGEGSFGPIFSAIIP